MSYEVVFAARAEKVIERLDRTTIARIKPRVLALAVTPRPVGCTKLAGQGNLWRIRVGDYRVVYSIDDAKRRVK